MYIVGIDIAKRKHEAAVIDGEGTVIIKPFSFTNNCSGYNRLLAIQRCQKPYVQTRFTVFETRYLAGDFISSTSRSGAKALFSEKTG